MPIYRSPVTKGLMLIQLDEFENVLREHQFTLHDLQEQLLKLNKESPSVYTNVLLDTTEDRRQTMVSRLFYMRQYKLKTFFDEAPVMGSTLQKIIVGAMLLSIQKYVILFHLLTLIFI